MWLALFTLYVVTVLLKRQGPLREVATDKTFYFIGSLMFAFTVFYAYVTFFQYFIIWNAQRAGGNLLVRLARTRHLVGRRHDHHFRPFFPALSPSAAH